MRILSLFIFIFSSFIVRGQVNGVVLDEENAPLVGATVLMLPDSTYTATDVNGKFSFDNLEDNIYELIVTYIGYYDLSQTVVVLYGASQQLTIQMEPDEHVIETIVVTEEHAKQEETLHTDHVDEDFLQKNLDGNFAQTIEKIAGISAINVGVGIAKPVIRGLSSNRIIVNHQGIKQESQQWGSDHGLEIDQFDVERVEIIKGPGSLQYGSDGLGGVINIMPDKILPKNSFAGSVIGLYKSNNAHWGTSAKLGFNVKNWFLSARYTRQDFADYSVPANIFTYNGFDLPILNNRLKNTSGDESNISINAGVSKKWGIIRLHFSHYSLDAGLFSGAVGVPRSYALTDDGNYRDIDVPQQQVDHYRFSLNQTYYFGRNHLNINFGLQRNLRREFSQPEFHSIPLSQLEDPNDKLALELLLETISFASHYEHHFGNNWKNIVGFNTQWQRNKRGGFEYLLPDFKTFRGGLYSIIEKEINEQLIINGGLRLDLGQNNTDFYKQYVWNSNEVITDSLISVATDDLFFNWSASFGTSWTIADGKWNFQANLGKSFRVPYPAETVSNGIHHGTFRHEVGSPDLKSEHGYQLDLGVNLTTEKFESSLSTYFNYFQNYIYLGPTFPARFSQLPEAGQIFEYRQDNAIYAGFELTWDWTILNKPKLALHQAIDFVQSFNPETKLALPFTPQPSIKTDFHITPYESDLIQELYVELSHQYHFAASGRLRIDRSERATPGYQLFGIGIGSKFVVKNQEIGIKFQAQNLLNEQYLAHLSRYRIINVPEQGRNFVLSVKLGFGAKLKKSR